MNSKEGDAKKIVSGMEVHGGHEIKKTKKEAKETRTHCHRQL